MDRYRRLFMDATYWAPFVRAVCERHGLQPANEIRAGPVPGTYPVFIVDDRWVVKFFGTQFNGQRTFAVELEVNRLLSATRAVPSPALAAHGHLLEGDGEGCRWPYLIFEFMREGSLGEVRERMSPLDKMAIARAVGAISHRLHSVDLRDTAVLRPTWDYYYEMLRSQSVDCAARHRAWRSLPEPLIGQIEGFLPPPEELVAGRNRPALLHGDLTADHILVAHDGAGWKLKAIIDYGDALVGDPLYELIALHLDLFRYDKGLLRECLAAYGCQEPIGSEMARKLLSLCLLFPFNAFHDYFIRNPAASAITNLEELADRLWCYGADTISRYHAKDRKGFQERRKQKD